MPHERQVLGVDEEEEQREALREGGRAREGREEGAQLEEERQHRVEHPELVAEAETHAGHIRREERSRVRGARHGG